MAPLAKVAVVIGVGPGACRMHAILLQTVRGLQAMIGNGVWFNFAQLNSAVSLSGIGAASAKKFASKGYSVALLSRSLDKLTPVESEISKAGGKAISLPTDVGEASDHSGGT